MRSNSSGKYRIGDMKESDKRGSKKKHWAWAGGEYRYSRNTKGKDDYENLPSKESMGSSKMGFFNEKVNTRSRTYGVLKKYVGKPVKDAIAAVLRKFPDHPLFRKYLKRINYHICRNEPRKYRTYYVDENGLLQHR